MHITTFDYAKLNNFKKINKPELCFFNLDIFKFIIDIGLCFLFLEESSHPGRSCKPNENKILIYQRRKFGRLSLFMALLYINDKLVKNMTFVKKERDINVKWP